MDILLQIYNVLVPAWGQFTVVVVAEFVDVGFVVVGLYVVVGWGVIDGWGVADGWGIVVGWGVVVGWDAVNGWGVVVSWGVKVDWGVVVGLDVGLSVVADDVVINFFFRMLFFHKTFE